MSVLNVWKTNDVMQVPENHFVVVHPLDDNEELKIDTSTLGPMAMTASVRFSLLALRGYLVLMMLLVLYHVLDLAGAIANGAR